MREGWVETTLGEVAEVLMGQSPPGSTYNTKGDGMPFIQGSAEFGARHPEPVQWCSAPKKVAEPGDLLVSVRAPVGDLNFAHEAIAVGRGLAVLRGTESARVEFIGLAIQHAIPDLRSRAGGGMFESITKQGLLGLQLRVPPLAEQRRIVDLIAAVDEAVERTRRCEEVSADLYRSTLIEGFEALNEATPSRPLAELSTARLGKMLNKAAKTGVDEYPYVRNADVQWDELRLADLNTMYFSESDRKEFALLAGDVLICEGGEVGRTAVVNENLEGVFFQKAIHRVRCGPDLLPRFLMHYMRFCAMTGGLADFATSLTIAHLTGEKLRTLPTPAPPIADQEDLVGLLDSILDYKRRAGDEVQRLVATRSAILSELLSGNHEIPESYDELLEDVA